MAKQLVYRGGAPNDGQGDSLYNAFKKVNENFTELYGPFLTLSQNNITLANNLFIGNTTTNAVINSSSLILKAGNTLTINSSSITTGNASVYSISNNTTLLLRSSATVNSQLTSSSLLVRGNAVNTQVNSTFVSIRNSNSTNLLTASELNIGNSTVNSTVNSSVITIQQANVTTNTFTLGTSNVSSNGYSRLPNGLLHQWGMVSANSTNTKIDFSTGFTNSTSVFSIVLTPRNTTYDSTYFPMILTSSQSNAVIRTGNATAINVFYTAIGV